MNLQNKKILVTGAEGFIGSHLVEALLNKGASVRALSLYNSFNHWGWLEKNPAMQNVEIISGDIRDPSTCKAITKNIEVVFHLAALVSIPYSYEVPEAFIETNVKGTSNLCRAAMENQCKRFIHTSSSEVYGSALYVPINEAHPLQPQSPYSASKIGADSIAGSYHYTYGLPLTIVRPFNTYGPRQSARAIIPTIITQIAKENKQIALGNINTTRDFTFVEDTCQGFISLAECQQAIGETVNIGTNTEISMKKLFEKINQLMGKSASISMDQSRVRPEKSEVQRLCCNNDKLCQLTGFIPKISLDQGLQMTIDWFTHPLNLSLYKPEIYNI
jgi:NAD dependent epimerase/dehydratase